MAAPWFVLSLGPHATCVAEDSLAIFIGKRGGETLRRSLPKPAENRGFGPFQFVMYPVDNPALRHDQDEQEHGKRQHCSAESQKAYARGDGGAAHDLSQEAKNHGQKADDYNRQASEYIFRENNAVGRVDGDTIDLHGQFVEEAEEILEQRIKYAKSTGQNHLHV
ncbi:MAG: DUF1771 domain-containing protein [Cytophagaceae bacterium]|nr:MAG: DUF1771 domain-containing protein [Cytophagaceae bacterium]